MRAEKAQQVMFEAQERSLDTASSSKHSSEHKNGNEPTSTQPTSLLLLLLLPDREIEKIKQPSINLGYPNVNMHDIWCT